MASTRVGDETKPKSGPPHSEPIVKRLCAIHGVVLSNTGYCPVAEAYWYPRFFCEDCQSRLWVNGFCPTCTPKTGYFVGHYFRQRFDDLEARDYGHYVLVERGPQPVPTAAEIGAFLAELRAVVATVGRAGAHG